MTNLEMVQKLTENPKRKAHKVDKYGATYATVYVNNNGAIIYQASNDVFTYYVNDTCIWEIIEPTKELRKMSFAEAVYYAELNNKRCSELKSCLTSLDYSRNDIALDEYKGLWTVEGIYEEE